MSRAEAKRRMVPPSVAMPYTGVSFGPEAYPYVDGAASPSRIGTSSAVSVGTWLHVWVIVPLDVEKLSSMSVVVLCGAATDTALTRTSGRRDGSVRKPLGVV